MRDLIGFFFRPPFSFLSESGGIVALVFSVVGLACSLAAIGLLVCLYFEIGPQLKIVAVGLAAFAALCALVAWVVFTGCFFSAVSDLPGDDFTADYALILVAISMLLLGGSAATLFLYKPDAPSQGVPLFGK